MEVDIIVRAGRPRPAVARLRSLAREILQRVSAPGDQVSILLTRDEEIRSLNRRYRGIDRPTDVLSFPAREDGLGEEGHLGDVVISVQSAERQARQLGWRTGEEIEFLLLHGLLHLLGYDHEIDKGQMKRLQSRLARRLLKRPVPPRKRSSQATGVRPPRPDR